MKHNRFAWIFVSVAVCISLFIMGSPSAIGAQETESKLPAAPLAAVGTAFTYQGYLEDGDMPANGVYDFEFMLFDVEVDGVSLGTYFVEDVTVEDGLFSVKVEFGIGAFDGDTRWLAIGVRPGGETGPYTPLAPRQPITPAPYALYAVEAGSMEWSGLSGIPSGLDDGDDDTTTFWDLSGTSGTNPLVHYVGTSDNQGLVLRVNATHVLRLEPTSGTPNIIGGDDGNSVTPGVVGAVIAGGGRTTDPNTVTDNYGAVGGGIGNRAGNNDGTLDNADYATVGGGLFNDAIAEYATVGGGNRNAASGNSSTVGGGYSNDANEDSSTVGGGTGNDASGYASTVGGGIDNNASGYAPTIGGGFDNNASGWVSTIGGGYNNSVIGAGSTVCGGSSNSASAEFATIGGGGDDSTENGNRVTDNWGTVGGGRDNQAGDDAGTTEDMRYATVVGGNNNAASGWATTSGGGSSNTASGSYATISGGYGNTASGYASLIPGGHTNEASGNYSFAAGRRAKGNNNGCFVWGDSTDADVECSNNNRWVVRSSGGVYFYSSSGLTSGTYMPAGANSWSGISDRRTKENFRIVDSQAILDGLAAIPVQEYNLKSQDPAIRHIGLVSQDFAAFGYGESNLAINMQDADGVALAAIQGLYAISQEQAETIETINAENQRLTRELEVMDSRLDRLERREAVQGINIPGIALGALLMAVIGMVTPVIRRRVL